MSALIQSAIGNPTYKPQAEDTNIENDVFFFSLLRQRSDTDRLLMGASMTQDARRLSLLCLQKQFGDLLPQQFAKKVAMAWLQEDCPDSFTATGNEMTRIQDSTGIASQLHQIFEQLGIPYYITRGVAAIAYGEPRTTRDLDVVMEIELSNLDQLVVALESDGFYVSGVEDVKAGRMQTLSVTHIASISRADLVLATGDEFDQSKFARRRTIAAPSGEELYFSSPEDLILAKLLWGQRSQSEKQWRDVLGVLKVQAEALDYGYLTDWGERLGIGNELRRVMGEAGI